jgi:hypothetical protein
MPCRPTLTELLVLFVHLHSTIDATWGSAEEGFLRPPVYARSKPSGEGEENLRVRGPLSASRLPDHLTGIHVLVPKVLLAYVVRRRP